MCLQLFILKNYPGFLTGGKVQWASRLFLLFWPVIIRVYDILLQKYANVVFIVKYTLKYTNIDYYLSRFLPSEHPWNITPVNKFKNCQCSRSFPHPPPSHSSIPPHPQRQLPSGFLILAFSFACLLYWVQYIIIWYIFSYSGFFCILLCLWDLLIFWGV